MDYRARVRRLQQVLEQEKVGAFLTQGEANIRYFTGLQMSAGRILATPKEAYLMVDGRYIEGARMHSPIPAHLLKEDLLGQLLRDIQEPCTLDSEAFTWQEVLHIESKGVSVQSQEGMVERLRAIKDAEEQVALRRAAELGSLGFDHVRSCLREGITEAEVAWQLELFWREKGAQGVAFAPIIAFGSHSALPHYRAGSAVLQRNQLVLIDIGVYLDGYHSDMTRVIFFGDVDPKLREIHGVVKEACARALKAVRAGVTIASVDAAARDYIVEQGYGEQFVHGLGHGVGLEIHEYPFLRQAAPYGGLLLEEGMAITIEPGIYLSGLGGVRLEDTVIVTKEGAENLTLRPKDYDL